MADNIFPTEEKPAEVAEEIQLTPWTRFMLFMTSTGGKIFTGVVILFVISGIYYFTSNSQSAQVYKGFTLIGCNEGEYSPEGSIYSCKPVPQVEGNPALCGGAADIVQNPTNYTVDAKTTAALKVSVDKVCPKPTTNLKQVPGTEGDSTVQLRWLKIEGAVTYNVYRDTKEITSIFAQGKRMQPLDDTVKSPIFTDSTTEAGKTYHYVVTGVTAKNAESAISNMISVKIKPSGPPLAPPLPLPLPMIDPAKLLGPKIEVILVPAPQNLTVKKESTKVILEWDALMQPLQGGFKYNVYRDTAAIDSLTKDGTKRTPLNMQPLTTTTYEDSDLTSKMTRYHYVVTTINYDGVESKVSNDVNIIVGNISLDMGSTVGESGTKLGLIGDGTPTDGGLVIPVDIDGVITGTTKKPLPAAPKNLTIQSGNSLLLDWDNNTEPNVTYNVYRDIVSTVKISNTTRIATNLNESSFTDSSTQQDITYYYFVTAKNTTGESAASNVASGKRMQAMDTQAPQAPKNLKATNSNGKIKLDWDNNNEADLVGYYVYRSPVAQIVASSQNKISNILAPSEYYDNNTQKGLMYYYVVTAVDQSGNESQTSLPASMLIPADPVLIPLDIQPTFIPPVETVIPTVTTVAEQPTQPVASSVTTTSYIPAVTTTNPSFGVLHNAAPRDVTKTGPEMLIYLPMFALAYTGYELSRKKKKN